MSRTMNEQKVLKKLDIPDFKHITKDKVISMATMLDKMDPEVAKKALEQFPNFANTMGEILAEFKQSLDKAFESNDKSVMSYYETCNVIIECCQKELEKEELLFEQRKEILDQMIIVAKLKGEKDTENKKLIVALTALGVVAFGFTANALLTAIGGNSKINFDKMKK